MSDLAAELRALHEAGVEIDGDFEHKRDHATERARTWEAELQKEVEQLGDATAAPFKNLTPIPQSQQIGFLPGNSGVTYDPMLPRGSGLGISSTHTRLPGPSGDWAMGWQCHRSRLQELKDLLKQLGPVPTRKKTGPKPKDLTQHKALAQRFYDRMWRYDINMSEAARRVVKRLGWGNCAGKDTAIDQVRKSIVKRTD